jgi:hypothetical protein
MRPEKIIRIDISQLHDVVTSGPDHPSNPPPEVKFGILFAYSIIWFMIRN